MRARAKKSVTRQTSPQLLLFQLAWATFFCIIVYSLLLAFYPLPKFHSIIIGMALYFILSTLGRIFLLKAHRKGMIQVHRKNFRQAAIFFKESDEFLGRHPWLDELRWLLLMSSSAVSFREMALYNAAYCYVQMGQGRDARDLYQRLLTRYPQTPLRAKTEEILNALKKSVAPSTPYTGPRHHKRSR